MRALLWSAAALIVGLTIALPAKADDAAKKVIDKAIKAHGGADILNKQKDKGVIQKGKMKIYANGMELDATVETTIASGPGKDRKFKQDIQLSVMGQDVKQLVVFDGKAMWIAINGKIFMTYDKKEDLEKFEEAAFAEEAAGLVLLSDKEIETSIIGEDKVLDTPVIGIRVAKKGRKDVSLYFEKESGLLKKIHSRTLDFMSGNEVEQERIFDDYKEVDGQKRPQRAVVNQDGKKLVEIEFSETKIVDSVEESAFDKPKE